MWDLKTETSTPISSNAGYCCSERMQRKIESKLDRGIYVAVDQPGHTQWPIGKNS